MGTCRSTSAASSCGSVSTSAGSSGVEGRHELGQHIASARRRQAGPHGDVGGDQRDPIAGPGRDGAEQQAGVQRGVQSWLVAEPGGRRPAGVDGQHDVPVALGPPRADDDVTRARRRPPVDCAHVVADHVGAQRVELAALPALAYQDGAVELAQPGQLLGQEAPRPECGQHPQRARYGQPALPGGHAQRPERAHRHLRRAPFAPACGLQRRADAATVARADVDRLQSRRRSG